MLINQKIAKAIRTDADFNLRQQELLVRLYQNADSEQQELINQIFIALCGYSLETFINEKN